MDFDILTNCVYEGMDIPDIEQVVQFMVPSSLSIWTQRFGQAGRSGQPAIAILLAESSAFQTKKKNKTKASKDNAPSQIDIENIKPEPQDDELVWSEDELDDPDEVGPVEYRKKLKDGMRQWITPLTCHRDISNNYFHNPPSTSGMSCTL